LLQSQHFMNVIELFESLKIDRKALFHFEKNDLIRLEKQINVEKKINPEIDTNVASNLILALNSHKEAFNFIVNNQILYNFFAKKNHPKNHFYPAINNLPVDEVKVFIEQFLEDDFLLFFNKEIGLNKFKDLSVLLECKFYLPESLLFKIKNRVLGKLEFAVGELKKSPIDKNKIQYIKDKQFYFLLSHFSSSDVDWKLNSLIGAAVDLFNRNRLKDFLKQVLVAMSYYNAVDEQIIKILKSNKKAGGGGLPFLGSFNGRWWWFIGYILIRVLAAVFGGK
jgi:hypothetical protein